MLLSKDTSQLETDMMHRVLPLPPEIRNKVYRLLFNNSYRFPMASYELADLSILRVSRKTYEEA